MKILAINVSPRTKGNSDLLCDEFIRGAEESGNQVEKISLQEKTIAPPARPAMSVSKLSVACNGTICRTCWKRLRPAM